MTALTLRDVEAADRLALARLDDDGAPAAVTSVISPGSAKNARILAGAAAGAPAAIPGGLPSPRVSFDPAPIRHGAVDGGWWPRSRNAHVELPGLIAALDAWPGVRVQRVALHRDEWDGIPHRLTADNGHLVTVDWFTTISRHTVSVTTAGGREPIALLVVPPSTRAEAAWDAMNTAATGPGTAKATDILTAEDAQGTPVSTGRSPATGPVTRELHG
jgi:Family of unknown function (DUF5994)